MIEQPISNPKRNTGLLVYTVICGDYDELVDPVVVSGGVRYICFTDNRRLRSRVWEIFDAGVASSPVDGNRRIKLLPHRFLPPHEFSLYVDGNVKIVGDIEKLMRHYASLTKIAAPKHPFRRCIYDEALACIQGNRGDPAKILEVTQRYRDEGCPSDLPIFEMNVVFRKTYDKDIISLMESWWNEYSLGAMRDQLSFPYLVWRSGLMVTPLLESPRYSREIFRLELHNHEKSLNAFRRFVLRCRLNRRNSRLCRIVSNLADLAAKSRKLFLPRHS